MEANVGRIRGMIVILLVVVGLVWIGQGLGVIRGQSFMIDDIRWAWIGGALVLAGVGVAVRGRLRR